MNELHEKRTNAAKQIAGGVVKFLVGAFFGATAEYITRGTNAPKLERYSIIAGGAMVGLYVGGQASNQVCMTIDAISDRMLRLEQAKEEEK